MTQDKSHIKIIQNFFENFLRNQPERNQTEVETTQDKSHEEFTKKYPHLDKRLWVKNPNEPATVTISWQIKTSYWHARSRRIPCRNKKQGRPSHERIIYGEKK
jgi:hypothetical protein